MRANETGLLHGRNHEYLHQFRVGLRRLRSVLRVYRPLLAPLTYGELTAEIRWLSTILGCARDWDVFIDETLAPLQCSAGGELTLASLRRRSLRRRLLAVRIMQAALASSRYTSLQQSLETLAATPCWVDDAEAAQHVALPAFAAQRIARREKSAHRLADRNSSAAGVNSAMRHELRIATKKLRYTVDFFDSLFERSAARDYADALGTLQDALGQLNDCATARRLLEAMHAGRSSKAYALERGQVLELIARREQRAAIALDSASWQLRQLQPFWK